MTPTGDPGTTVHALLADGSAILKTASTCWPHTRAWLPLSCTEFSEHGTARATLAVEALTASADPRVPESEPTVRVGEVRAWIDHEQGHAALRGRSRTRGSIDLRSLTGHLHVDLDSGERAGTDLYSMLTIASALLLGRMGCVLIHAGAVVARDGRGWLVVGDARSGKSTTCVSLAACGLGLLSDDQVVLRPSGDAVQVEGWLRPLHLDEGWERGVPQGQRRTLHPSAFGQDGSPRHVPVSGTIHTAVEADAPTRVTELSAADAFTRLVRQSPWLLADRAVAPAVVETLTRVAGLPRLSLRLGLDTFGRPERMRELLASIPF